MSAEKQGRGGARKGAGRPRLGQGDSVRLHIVAPLESVAVWRHAAELAEQDFSEWARDALDASAERMER